MERRSFILILGAAAVGLGYRFVDRRWRIPVPSLGGVEKVTIVEFTDAGERTRTVSVAKITKTEEEWKRQLSPISFEVTRHAETERPFTGPLLNEHGKGVFRCICCDTALFDSRTKFDSGTGWPSFWTPIAKENVVEKTDTSLGMVRIEVSCRRCDAHLGHVFDDGPRPTGLRFCVNSESLVFVDRKDLASLADPAAEGRGA
jgi:peptide-methionine (R)-S-oxide reductase